MSETINEPTVQVFESEQFGSIRTLMIDNEVWFVGKDVAEALGYTKARNAILSHVDDEDKIPALIQGGCSTGTQKTTIINESGLYSLILSSRLPSAKGFKRWVTSEVLPSIRRYGAYLTDETLSKVTGNTEEAERLFRELKEEKLRVKKLREECGSLEDMITVLRQSNELLSTSNVLLEKRIEVLEPKANYYDSVIQDTTLIPVTLIAKDYGMTATKLNSLLYGFGIQYPRSHTWALYEEYDHFGYTQTIVENMKCSTTGRKYVCMYWTHKGRKFLYDLLKKYNILPVSEHHEEENN